MSGSDFFLSWVNMHGMSSYKGNLLANRSICNCSKLHCSSKRAS